QVNEVQLDTGKKRYIGTLHLTAHQLIFSHPEEELWIAYPILHTVERQSQMADGLFPLRIRCHHFLFVTLSFRTEQEAIDVYESMQKLTCIASVEQLHAFFYQPTPPRDIMEGWSRYDPKREYARMGVGVSSDEWRFTSVNENYELCATYPHCLVVPSKISDAVLSYAAKFRSKGRIPTLSYLHKPTMTTITRSSQPMIGLRQSRSIQDEKLVEAIFNSGRNEDERMVMHQRNLIVDARPTANAMANVAMGAGSESTENYRSCRKLYLGIDNIHVMRDSLNRISLLDGVSVIVRTVHHDQAHVLVHCSDGWDRTAQLTALASLCLDPYYRTIEGFSVLVEKEWCSFGHKFSDRCGHLTHERDFQVAPGAQASAAEATISSIQSRLHQQSSHVRETSPVFHQFLDCCYQLWTQAPWRFEFNERFLIALHYNAYACQFGTFLCNTDRERRSTVQGRSHSVWPHLDQRRDEFSNVIYDAARDRDTDQGVIVPDT
ncbi:protein-tyrosine phosphatase-like protein, partial [Thamnocephalis sphaerospora]